MCTVTLAKFASRRTLCLLFWLFLEMNFINRIIFVTEPQSAYSEVGTEILCFPLAARSKACVCGRSLAGIASWNPTWCMDISLLCVMWCLVEVSASGWSLLQRSQPSLLCLSEASIMSKPWPTRGCCAMKTRIILWILLFYLVNTTCSIQMYIHKTCEVSEWTRHELIDGRHSISIVW
jgi:hypothetical protein